MTRAFAQEIGAQGAGTDGFALPAENAENADAAPGPGDSFGEAAGDLAGDIAANPAIIWNKIAGWIEGAYRLVPNLVAALLLLLVFVAIAWIARWVFHRWATRRGRANLGDVLGSFIKWAIIVFGILLALTVILPTLNPGDLLAGLGIGSVAIGFAFKDILQNWLAGLLLLLRQPFEVGDQIIVNDYEGTVQRIESRATLIKTYDGRRVIIPNSDVYTNATTVNTAFPKRRSEYDVGIGYSDGIGHARDVIVAALQGIEGVEDDPAPEALCWDLSASWVTMRVRWWTATPQVDVVHVKAKAIEAIKHALDDAGIDMPFDTQVQLFHDQTEEWDGDRSRQREGWPADSQKTPRPARVAEREERASSDGASKKRPEQAGRRH